MTNLTSARGAIAGAIAAFAFVSSTVAADLPIRKPGHWRITSISAAYGMTTIDACIGPNDSLAATTTPGTCSPPTIEHAADQVIVTVDCKTAEGRERTSTLFTGDFTSWYRGIVKMSFDPPSRGRTNMGITIDAKFVDEACREDAGALRRP